MPLKCSNNLQRYAALQLTTCNACNELYQQLFLCRLRELQQQFVGGELANNEDIKQRRQKKKKYAEERKRKLQGKYCLIIFRALENCN
jgi:hypothetical protein